MDPGLLSTVQDLGRRGYQHLGFSVGGASDVRSLMLANYLAGNPASSAALEMTVLGARLRFSGSALVGVVGVEPEVLLDNRPADASKTLVVRPGAELAILGMAGARTYLAVRGGFDVAPVMGSRATDLVAGIGGLGGRPLERGDRLPISTGLPASARRRVAPEFWLRPKGLIHVRFCPDRGGPALERERSLLTDRVWEVGSELDRTGIRMVGEAIPGRRGQILSEGQPPGAIQLPGNGLPIVLLGARQTVGGYPKLGVVGPVGLAALAQAMPGTRVTFEPVDSDEMALESRTWLAALSRPELCTEECG
jgi:antagonist of KipI